KEARAQARRAIGRLPDVVVACVGGGSNAIGLFHPFIADRRVGIVGVEPGGSGIASGKHGASMTAGAVGVLHGSMSYLLQSDDGQVRSEERRVGKERRSRGGIADQKNKRHQ